MEQYWFNLVIIFVVYMTQLNTRGVKIYRENEWYNCKYKEGIIGWLSRQHGRKTHRIYFFIVQSLISDMQYTKYGTSKLKHFD